MSKIVVQLIINDEIATTVCIIYTVHSTERNIDIKPRIRSWARMDICTLEFSSRLEYIRWST